MKELRNIITLHKNRHMCGVSKFNYKLAELQGWIYTPLEDPNYVLYNFPIISVSFIEFSDDQLADLCSLAGTQQSYGLIIHAIDLRPETLKIISRASWIMSLNLEIYETVATIYKGRHLHGWTPGLIELQPSKDRSVGRRSRSDEIFVFGMSKKFETAKFIRLSELAQSAHIPLKVSFSAGLHENSRFDDEFFSKVDELTELAKVPVRFLGFLSDGEVSERLQNSRLCALFFRPAARSNNTTLMTALEHGSTVITNLDSFSPAWMRDSKFIFNLDEISKLPDPQVFSPEQIADWSWTKFQDIIP